MRKYLMYIISKSKVLLLQILTIVAFYTPLKRGQNVKSDRCRQTFFKSLISTCDLLLHKLKFSQKDSF